MEVINTDCICEWKYNWDNTIYILWRRANCKAKEHNPPKPFNEGTAITKIPFINEETIGE